MSKHLLKILKIFGSEIGLKIISGVSVILIGRILSVADYAVYFFTLTVINLSVNIPSNFFSRVIYIRGQNTEESDSVKLQYSIILSSLLLFLLFSPLIISEPIWIIVLSILIVTSKTLYSTELSLIQRSMLYRIFYTKELIRTVAFCSFFVLIFVDEVSSSVEYFLLAHITSLSVAFIYRYRKREWFPIIRILVDTKKIYHQNRHVAIYATLFLLLTSLDTLMIKTFSTEAELANFGAASTLYSFLLLAVSAVHKYMLPTLYQNESIVFYTVMRSIRLVSIILIPLWLILTLFTKDLFALLYGYDKYVNAHMVFNILSLSAIFSFMLGPWINVLNVQGNFRFLSNVIFIVLILHVILSYLVLPVFGSIGIAYINLILFLLFHLIVYSKAKKVI